MAHIAAGSSTENPRERLVTLPPIRDIFRDQLAPPSSQSSRPRPSRSSSQGGLLHPGNANELTPYTSASRRAPSVSPDMRYSRGERIWGNVSPQRAAAPALRSSHSFGGAPSRESTDRVMSGSYRPSSVAPTAKRCLPSSGYRYVADTAPGHVYNSPSGSTHMSDSSRSAVGTNNLWSEHRRRDSAESVWSSQSSSSSASPYLRSNPPPNALQFQPLPPSQAASSYSRPSSLTDANNTARPTPFDYQSPFGVLIADVDARGVPPADPQRTAIIRTLRTSGVQGSFQIHFDDPTNAHNAPRYSCQYCGKGFARPSSLRIHNNSHTGEKPFQCPYPDCGRRFSVHSNMRRHFRVHGGDAPKNGESSGDEVGEE